MVFKIETVVAALTAVLLAAVSITSYAADPDASTDSAKYSECSSLRTKSTDVRTEALKEKDPAAKADLLKEADSLRADWDRCQKDLVTKDSTVTCGTALKKFVDAKDEFAGACGTAHMGEGGPKGSIACSDAIAKCSCTSPNSTAKICEDMPQVPAARGASDLINIQQKKAQFNICPSLAEEDVSTIEQQMKESKKTIEDLKEKASQKEQAAIDIENASKDKMDGYQSELSDAEKDHAQAVSDAKKSKNETVSAFLDQVAQKDAELAQIDQQILDNQFKATTANIEYQEQLKQTDLTCYHSASDTVEKLQQARLAQPFNRGGFNEVLRAVGVSDRAAWQREAMKFYRYCLRSAPTKAQKDSALKAYNAKLQAVRDTETSLRAQRTLVEAAKNQLQSPEGCGNVHELQNGTRSGTKICQAAVDGLAAQDEANAAFAKAQRDVASKAKTEAAKSALAAQKKRQEVAETQQQITDEKNRLENLKQFYALHNQGTDASVPKSDRAAASKAFHMLTSAAQDVIRECPKKECGEKTTCGAAGLYLDAIKAEKPESVDEELDGEAAEPPSTIEYAPDATGGANPAIQENQTAPADEEPDGATERSNDWGPVLNI